MVELFEAVAEILKAVAWPIAISVAIYSALRQFKKEIAHFKYKDAEAKAKAKFEFKALEVVKAEYEKVRSEGEDRLDGKVTIIKNEKATDSGALETDYSFPSLVKGGHITDTKEYNSFWKVAQVSPRGAVLGAWSEVEWAVLSLAKAAMIETKYPLDVLAATGILQRREIVSTSLFQVFHSLLDVKNRASRDPDFDMDADEAELYIGVTLMLAADLLILKEKLGDHDGDTPQT